MCAHSDFFGASQSLIDESLLMTDLMLLQASLLSLILNIEFYNN